MGNIYIGTSGFSFDDWIGEVYPHNIKKDAMLTYYEKVLGFEALEVNYTYYAMPTQKTMASFMRKTSRNFYFTVKAYKGLTHEREDSLEDQCKRFKDGIAPLGENLKALLFQFPYTFLPEKKTIDYLKTLRKNFHDNNIIAEFRNVRWFQKQYIDMLKGLSWGWCIVDEPKLKGLVPFSPVLTSEIGYFRFHGRNKAWFGEPVNIRYDYLYTEEELKSFIPSITHIAGSTSCTFVFFNNCHQGKAVKNAQMLKEMLKDKGRENP